MQRCCVNPFVPRVQEAPAECKRRRTAGAAEAQAAASGAPSFVNGSATTASRADSAAGGCESGSVKKRKRAAGAASGTHGVSGAQSEAPPAAKKRKATNGAVDATSSDDAACAALDAVCRFLRKKQGACALVKVVAKAAKKLDMGAEEASAAVLQAVRILICSVGCVRLHRLASHDHAPEDANHVRFSSTAVGGTAKCDHPCVLIAR
jgi:hypothetical protein